MNKNLLDKWTDSLESLEEAGHSIKDASFILVQMIQNSLQYEK